MSNELNWTQILPDGWLVMPLKAISNYLVSNVDKLTKEDEIPVELCNYTDVYKNDYITSDLEFMLASATEEEIQKFQLNIGDVLITKDSESWDDIGIPALVVETKEKLLCGYHLAIIKSYKTKIIPEYLFRCIEAKIIRVQLELASTGVTRFGLPKDEIGRLKLPIPKLQVQEKIVSFLKIELLSIDRLIIQKERLINILTEKRQALIAKAVTRGLDQNVKLKNSRVDWVGDVPEHWEVSKMSRIFQDIGSGTTPTSSDRSYYEGGTINWVLTGDLNDDILKGTSTKITEKALQDYTALRIYPKGSLCVAMYGATIGKTSILDIEACTNQACCVLSNSMVADTRFIQYLLIAKRNDVIMLANGGGQPNISQNIIRDMRLSLPPLSEQIEIIDYVENNVNKLELIKVSVEKSIFLLKERRTALISATVTGQIEIPELS